MNGILVSGTSHLCGKIEIIEIKRDDQRGEAGQVVADLRCGSVGLTCGTLGVLCKVPK